VKAQKEDVDPGEDDEMLAAGIPSGVAGERGWLGCALGMSDEGHRPPQEDECGSATRATTRRDPGATMQLVGNPVVAFISKLHRKPKA